MPKLFVAIHMYSDSKSAVNHYNLSEIITRIKIKPYLNRLILHLFRSFSFDLQSIKIQKP